MIDEAIGGVEVLGRFVIVRHRSTRVTDDAVIAVADGNHDARPEEVVIGILLLRVHDKPKLLQYFFREHRSFDIVNETIPSAISEAYAAFFDEIFTPTIACVCIGGACFVILVMDIGDVVLLNVFVGREHSFALLVLLMLFGCAFARIFLNINVKLICKDADRFREIDVLLLLDESDSITTFATTETMPCVEHWVDMERWRFFMVQRAATLELTTRRLQVGIIRDNVVDVHLSVD